MVIKQKALWFEEKEACLRIINQNKLPFEYELIDLHKSSEIYEAIKHMLLRGAPVIGAAAAYGVYMLFREMKQKQVDFSVFTQQLSYFKTARPTAVNLMYAVDWMAEHIEAEMDENTVLVLAKQYAKKDIEDCYRIGLHGFELIKACYEQERRTVNILTHCNAGWLATGAYGTATAPIYLAHEKGIPVHVWVDETRPRNQGARLTAWELEQAGVPFTIIPDNTGGHLMQHEKVDMVIVGSDRTTAKGDVANKIGTYLKALAAHDNKVPFYVALPFSTIDMNIEDGREIEIELRDNKEVSHMEGLLKNGQKAQIEIYPPSAKVANYAFDVTPARYVSGLITEKGIVKAEKTEIKKYFDK